MSDDIDILIDEDPPQGPTFEEVRDSLLRMELDHERVSTLIRILKDRRESLDWAVRRKLRPGATVRVLDGRHRNLVLVKRGTVVKVNPKRIIVSEPDGRQWNVDPSLIEEIPPAEAAGL